jgi:hypothetical protein
MGEWLTDSGWRERAWQDRGAFVELVEADLRWLNQFLI